MAVCEGLTGAALASCLNALKNAGGNTGSGPSVTDIVGTVTNPSNVYGGPEALGLLFSNILRLIFIGAGVFALLNFIMAGFQYMNSGGDTKLLVAAWNRIWLTLLGLIIIVGSFVFAAIIGFVFFGNPMFILSPVIYGAPTQ